MSDYWNSLADRMNGIYTADDFETAAYRLVSEQALYHADQRSRVSYAIVEQYEREFTKALAPLGITISVNRQLRYVAAIPTHAKATPATVLQTLFALVLLSLYHEASQTGNQTEDGEIFCDLVELGEKYRLMTGRELPQKGEFDGLMRTAKRWGIARWLDDEEATLAPSFGLDGQMNGIAIRPGIVDILGETALTRLANWKASDPGSHTSSTAEQEDTKERTDETA